MTSDPYLCKKRIEDPNKLMFQLDDLEMNGTIDHVYM